MKFVATLAVTALLAGVGLAGEVEIAGMTSKTPAAWKEETPSSNMRLAQFKLPKAEGDTEDAELIIFFFRGGSGSAEENFKRQLAKFKPEEGKEKVEPKMSKIKVGSIEAPYQDISGNYQFKAQPFNPQAKAVDKPKFRQLYVPVITEKGDFYFALVGPAKTVEKHKKDFDEFLKNFK